MPSLPPVRTDNEPLPPPIPAGTSRRRPWGVPAWLVSANVHLVLLLFLATQVAGENDTAYEVTLLVTVDTDEPFDQRDLNTQLDLRLPTDGMEMEPISSNELSALSSNEHASFLEVTDHDERQQRIAMGYLDGSRFGHGDGDGMATIGAPIGSPERAAKRYARLRVGVTDWIDDNIPEVLTTLGISYRHVRESNSPLEDFDVIFIGCGGRLPYRVATPSKLRHFVEQGGVLYVSDLSGEMLQGAFGKELGPRKHYPNPRREDCLVMDADLESVLGKKVHIHFNLSGWLYFPKPSSEVEVMLRLGSRIDCPLVLRLPCGKGRVVFTSFHNHSNLSAAEHMLVRSLVTELPK